MIASKTTISIRLVQLHLIAVCLLCMDGCTDVDTQDIGPHQTTDLLNRMWIADAMDFVSQFESKEPHYVIHSESSENGTICVWYMDESKTVYAAKMIAGDSENHFYFDSGLLNFSRHNAGNGIESVLVAYAQSKPYALALGTKDEWVVGSETLSPVSSEQLKYILTEKQSTERREKMPSLAGRLRSPKESVKSRIESREVKTYALNVLKGNEVRIELKSENPQLYFTTKPDNGTSMERRSWSHNADYTGDMLISVFSAEPESASEFELIVEKKTASN